MADRIQLIPGSAAKSSSIPPQENTGGLIYAADGLGHKAGWSHFVPPSLRTASPLQMRFALFDDQLGVGTVRFFIEYFSFSDTSGILTSGSTTLLFTINNVLNTLATEDVDISSWIDPNATILLINLERNSNHLDDTYGSNITFFNARTL